MVDWLKDATDWAGEAARGAAVQLDPVAALLALAALAYSIRANRRAYRMEKRDRDRAGQIDRVEISAHSFQPPLTGSLAGEATSPSKETGQAEYFRCSVYAGSTETDVDGVGLHLDFVEGWIRQNRVRVNIELKDGEGNAGVFPPLPQRMLPHSRLDWDLLPFLTFFPNHRGQERLLGGLVRVMSPREQLRFHFRAYSRFSSTPRTSLQEHRLSLLGIPLRRRRRNSMRTYESAWDLVMDEAAPPSLAAWLLPWVERRPDFDVRLIRDDSGQYEQRILDIKRKHYWPPGAEKEGEGILSLLATARRNGIPGGRLLALESALKTLVDGNVDGSPHSLTELDQTAMTLRSLHLRNRRRDLKKRELAEYRRARTALCSEIATVMALETDHAETYMDSVLLPQIPASTA